MSLPFITFNAAEPMGYWNTIIARPTTSDTATARASMRVVVLTSPAPYA